MTSARISDPKSIRIHGGRVIDPANNIDAVQDLYIANGSIVALGKAPGGFRADQEINAADIGFNIAEQTVYVPTFFDNRVVAYRLEKK